jgi:hypothetical protein
MTKNILEWGWHTSTPTSSSSDSEWKPATTLLGGDTDRKVAAVGDLRCESTTCGSGGSYGATAGYRVSGPAICRDCAVKYLTIEGLSGKEQDEVLKKFEIK